jgi:hypothetical protein
VEGDGPFPALQELKIHGGGQDGYELAQRLEEAVSSNVPRGEDRRSQLSISPPRSSRSSL